MARPGGNKPRLIDRRPLKALLAIALAGFAAWAVFAAWNAVRTAGAGALHALWLLPGLVALHLVQLLVSSKAWHSIVPQGPGLSSLYRLRIIREGIDSLLPVAQVGGEVVGAQLLSQRGPALPEAAASVVVDVTIEFLSQLAFLLAGIAALAMVSHTLAWQGWLGAALITAGLAASLLLVQRYGMLRLLEALARQIAARWPGVGSLAGLDAAASAIYARRGRLAVCAGLHWLSWMLGSLESWAVLHALGFAVTPAEAFVVEALGMAARSAGFAIPGALVIQETGFALAAASVGLPEAAGLSLSLLKRAREVSTGLLGLALWWLEQRRPAHQG